MPLKFQMPIDIMEHYMGGYEGKLWGGLSSIYFYFRDKKEEALIRATVVGRFSFICVSESFETWEFVWSCS